MNTKQISIAENILNFTAKIWFISAALGQFVFSYYILAFYGGHAVNADLNKWNMALTHGYVTGENMGNITLILHLIFAFIITIGGPVQFSTYIRKRFRTFHRINGRIYLIASLIMAITGLYLSLSGRKLAGDPSQQIPFALGGVLIITFALLTLRSVLTKDFKNHRRWALRLFLMVNGVWFFRVGLNFWLLIHGSPVGFDIETFQGPFLTILGYATFLGIIPLTMLQLYFMAQSSSFRYMKIITATILVLLTIGMIIGIYASAVQMWFPLINN